MRKSCLTMLLLSATAGHAATLMDAYLAARAHDATLQSAEATYRANTEQVPQAQAALKTQASVAANVTHTSEALPPIPIPGFPSTFAGTTAGYTLQLTQPLFHRDRQLQVGEAYQAVAQARATLETARQDLMLRVAQAYFNVLVAQDLIASLAAQKAAVRTQLAAARRSFEVGNTTITDVNEASARTDQVTAQQVAAFNQLNVALRTLEGLAGERFTRLNGLGARPGMLGLKTTGIDRWTEVALSRSLRIQAQEAGVRQASLEIEKQRAARLPSVDIVASDARTTGQLALLQAQRVDTLALQLAMPIYDGGLIASRVRQATANRDRSRSDLEQTRRDVSLQTQQAYLNVTAGMAQLSAYRQALRSALSSLNSTRLAVTVGVRTTVDLLNALQAYHEAVRNVADTRYNLMLNEIRLASAASVLSENDLHRANTVLTAPIRLDATPTGLIP